MKQRNYDPGEKAGPASESFLKRSEPDSHGSVRETHPSYGMVGISRRTGDSFLVGSEMLHPEYIALTIHEASRVERKSEDRYHAEKRIVEIHMTESQFAQMITQANIGDGVACTIRHCQGDQDYGYKYATRPYPPQPQPFADRYSKDISSTAQTVTKSLDTALHSLQGLLSGEAKPTKANLHGLRLELEKAQREFSSNLPYIMEVMNEAIEKRVATASLEFEAYVAHSLQAKGLEQARAYSLALDRSQKELPAPQDSDLP